MKKSLTIIGIVLFITGIIFTCAWIWVNGLKEDQKKTKEKMKIVQKSYDDFNKAIDEISDYRNNLYEQKEDLYYDTFAEEADYWNEFIEKYAKAIKKVEKTSKNLKKNCDIKYGDVSTNSKCTAFKANYEAAHNYYISDIKMYNEMIDEYNKWKEGLKNKYPEIKKGNYPIYKKYIDYDKDREYFGKEGEAE